ncbi:MAG: SRPBCC family protein [Planctomycetota bacterium]
MSPTKSETPSERELVLTREVEAPRELVWRLWTEREHAVRWWGPTGFTTTTHEMDVRVGGRWRFTFHGPDGHAYENLIHYLALERPARLVYRHSGEVNLEPIHFETTVTFEELAPARTRVTLRSVFPSAEAREHVVRECGAIEGGKQHLARLAELAAALVAGTGDGESLPLTMHRVLRAPRALVYDVWTSVEHLARWFGPKECTLGGCKLDLRPGGLFLYRMDIPGAPSHWGKWVFREIVPCERLVFEISFADEHGQTVRAPFDERWPLRMLATVTFEDHAGLGLGTVITLRSSALAATPEEQRTFDQGHPSMQQGWSGTFERLEEYVAAHQG